MQTGRYCCGAEEVAAELVLLPQRPRPAPHRTTCVVEAVMALPALTRRPRPSPQTMTRGEAEVVVSPLAPEVVQLAQPSR